MMILSIAANLLFLMVMGLLLVFQKSTLKHLLLQHFTDHREKFSQQQVIQSETLQSSLRDHLKMIQGQLVQTLNMSSENLNKRVDDLTQETKTHLKNISEQVEKRLSEGFEKTTATFGDVLKRLALIDQAQEKITELSKNIVGLEDILNDKRSRGAFGEIQLATLVQNVLPQTHYAFQHGFSNHRRADCALFMPAPTGTIAIDSKFPLENYQKMTNIQLADSDRKLAEQQFKIDVRKHIIDISSKYIISGETAEGAIMFIPAEAIFSEIHSNYPELVLFAQNKKVWLTSPTTMMAILTTAHAVLKDAATREQVHLIQKHLALLGEDFKRFQKRMDNLSKHITKVHDDVGEIHTSANKITKRFDKIDQVELEYDTKPALKSEAGE